MKTTLWKTACPYLLIMLPSFFSFTALNGRPVFYPFNDTLKENRFQFHDSLKASEKRIHLAAFPGVKLQPMIEKFSGEYIKQNSTMLDGLRVKKQSGFLLIDKIFEKNGLPVELKYLAVIESKLANSATSQAGAAGMWQLMPQTAKLMGLKITSKTDERRHSYKSTVAASKYLAILYKQFDDWLLVIAAYNSGPGTVCKAIKKSGSRDFWKLQYFLPKETRMHVRKFIATHFFYEGTGSMVTLTKSERKIFLDTLPEMMALKASQIQEPEIPALVIGYYSWVIKINEDRSSHSYAFRE